MKETIYYLKCEYGPGTWNHEYCIKFKSEGHNLCLVNKEDVKPITKTEGLAKIIVLSFEKDKALIEINNVGDMRISKFYVPKSEIVENQILINTK